VWATTHYLRYYGANSEYTIVCDVDEFIWPEYSLATGEAQEDDGGEEESVSKADSKAVDKYGKGGGLLAMFRRLSLLDPQWAFVSAPYNLWSANNTAAAAAEAAAAAVKRSKEPLDEEQYMTYYSTHCSTTSGDKACANSDNPKIADSSAATSTIQELYSTRYNRYFYDGGLGKYAAKNNW
jgi:hypothetical protein